MNDFFRNNSGMYCWNVSQIYKLYGIIFWGCKKKTKKLKVSATNLSTNFSTKPSKNVIHLYQSFDTHIILFNLILIFFLKIQTKCIT